MEVVVAIDGEDCAKSALTHMLSKKYPSDTKVHLIHVIVPGFADVAVEGIPDVVDEERKEEQAVLAGLASTLKESLNISATVEIIQGETADVIAKACERYDADECIVPSHARHGFSRIWFGSVADEIADAAPCTVIVLKMPKDIAIRSK